MPNGHHIRLSTTFIYLALICDESGMSKREYKEITQSMVVGDGNNY